ncbi:maleylpyruvate isomerase family mycothiol-dependent enzyme [Frankia sp. AgB1.9]|uniref:maleylpyruvate isomerase family mycothiol-dependent enzyme n=2 Tax=Frankia TaxID=1854 RepID=UPI0019328C73|nr:MULTISPECIES: maleylpyruvate isomerase family mycothiol-dependent enzyme [unclassified Frankia]MBL7492152.1 maleylpyruvate isomerase family mycothiol-dependent enzyme [Frankia sp. AgW1.1]MBL7547855.1 maleylpyruvate isomerase family mycothiol-dependent enzyme [Frankia sp. AgB1.9]
MTNSDGHAAGAPASDPHPGNLTRLASHLCDAADVGPLADHLDECPACARAEAERREIEQLLRAPDDGTGPGPALSRVLAAARARRRPAPELPAFAAAFGATAGMLDVVLAEVSDDVLLRPSPVLTWRLGDLVTHLAAGNALVADAVAIAVDPPVAADVDLVAHTERLLRWVDGWPRARVARLWRDGIAAMAERIRAEPALAREWVEVDGLRLPVGSHLVARAFETWIHARDLGVAAGLTVPSPPADSLAAMADLAAGLLGALPPRAATAPAGAVRLTLTGPGGGAWLVHLGGPPPAGLGAIEPAAGLVLDTVEFCLVAANRRAPEAARAAISGDAALAAELLTSAARLARP